MHCTSRHHDLSLSSLSSLLGPFKGDPDDSSVREDSAKLENTLDWSSRLRTSAEYPGLVAGKPSGFKLPRLPKVEELPPDLVDVSCVPRPEHLGWRMSWENWPLWTGASHTTDDVSQPEWAPWWPSTRMVALFTFAYSNPAPHMYESVWVYEMLTHVMYPRNHQT